MKYSITVSDLTASEVDDVVTKITGGDHHDCPYEEEPQLNLDTSTVTPVIQTFDNTAVVTSEGVELPEPVATPTVAQMPVDDEPDTSTVDKTGLPWDGRIHSGNEKQTTKGVWQRRRGIQDVEFNAVVAELRNAVVVPVVEPPTPSFPVHPRVAEDTAHVAVTAAGKAAIAAPVPIGRDFQGLMEQIKVLFAAEKIQADYLPSIVTRINDEHDTSVSTLTDIADEAQLVEFAWQCLEVDGKAA